MEKNIKPLYSSCQPIYQPVTTPYNPLPFSKYLELSLHRTVASENQMHI